MKSQGDYYKEKLEETLKVLPDLPIVEIGTAGGTTAFYALECLKKNNDKRWFFTIDPYGDKPYQAGGSILDSAMGYNDKLYAEMMKKLYSFAYENELSYLHWKLTSLDFMKIFPQIEFWSSEWVKLKPKFAWAFLDGDHSWNPVKEEFDFFYNHMPKGGVICIDDFNLLEGENEVRQRLNGYEGTWHFNYDDDHYRCYFTKT
ncbi:MAG: methyltransferase [Siphoviridae sp. cttb18]|nr:MAG: methyltransferase [Siphoviridae sp. cttb18]